MFDFIRQRPGLIAGDLITIALITLAGFQNHGTLASAGSRIWATLFPLAAAWFLVGLQVGVFEAERVRSAAQLWRPAWAMVLAAPLFGLLRSLLLGQATITAVFVLVMGGVGALAILAWRGAYLLWIGRGAAQPQSHG